MRSRQVIKGVIAAGHPLTVEAGARILRAGGNAFDAAIASIFASFVSESVLTSMGGGGFLIAHTMDNRNILYDFFSVTPGLGKTKKREIEFFSVDIEFAGAVQRLYIGRGSAGVPGILQGISEIYKRHATLPLKTLLEPAIGYAREGVVLNKKQASFIGLLEPLLTITEEGRKIYAPEGRLIREGDVIRNPGLLETLEMIGEDGIDAYISGEFKKRIMEGFSDHSELTEEDIDRYRVEVRKPLAIDYRGYRIETNPPPSSGGSLIALSLRLLDSLDLKGSGHNTYRSIKMLFETMKIVDTARKEDFCHLVMDEDGGERLLSEDNLLRYRSVIDAALGRRVGNTTHISIIDSSGNAVGVTTTAGIGCGYFIPDTGIMMNNMLGEEDVNPHGFHALPPGERLSSMMSPTIVLKGGMPVTVLGSGGSKRIRNAILQVIINLIDYGMDVSDAVNAPRIHWDGSVLQVEPGISEGDLRLLEEDGIDVNLWEERHMYFGGVHTVTFSGDGYRGEGDSRRGGVAEEVEIED